MIVSVTRDDLRDEFTMADEAFALSPISARATQPREEDYNAISEAFMETSRGRWFLGEYAKRNRNADTRMVLDAVARIEETIAAQKRPAPDDNRLAEALVALTAALVEARATATAALGDLALEENLAPARKGARVIREIAWRLREIGADGRICDLIDSQVSAIEGACGKIAAADPAPFLSAAFDLLEGRIKAFDDSESEAPQPADTVVPFPPQTAEKAAPEEATASLARAAEEAIIQSPARAADDEVPAAVEDMATAASMANDAEAAIGNPAMAAESIVPMAEAAEEMTAEAAEAAAEIADPSSEAADVSAEDAEAHDNAVLDMIALEMAAPDPDDVAAPSDDEIYEVEAEMQTAALPAAEPIIVAERPEPVIAPAQPAAREALQPSLPQPSLPQPSFAPAPEPSGPIAPEPSLEPSLGSSLIASGIVRARATSRPDPLAPIRRMSQAEKIAFFS
jgi:hypothetical protein